MKKRICQMAALGSALLLAFSAPVQAAAVTTNGTPAAVATNNIQNWPAGPETTSEAAVLIDADTGAVLYDKGMNECRYPASTTKHDDDPSGNRKQFAEGYCNIYRDRNP